MPLARASELDRLLACVGAVVLPTSDVRSLGVKNAAEWGNDAHYWVETGEIRTAKLAERIALSDTRREDWWPAPGKHEVAVALNLDTGAAVTKEDGTKDEKDAWKAAFGPNFIVGTLDYVGSLLDTPWVDDLKTGRQVTWKTYEAQQTFYCLCVHRAYYPDADCVRSTVTHWPRYPKHGTPKRFGRTISVDALDEFVVRLNNFREAVERARETETADLRGGSHCFFCPSKPFCTEGLKHGF